MKFILTGAINWANTWFKPDGRLSLDAYATLLEELVLVPEAPSLPRRQATGPSRAETLV